MSKPIGDPSENSPFRHAGGGDNHDQEDGRDGEQEDGTGPDHDGNGDGGDGTGND